ncbi:hypothetical protein SDC9_55090 [bioreactor metagenome]|uniref:Uncharacterized protein n=1 Tax=bioreactor metagenome TaxID=1076179 RepID=A0A644X3R0_9ZZZZ
MEVQVRAVRHHHRIEPANRLLRRDGPVAEPQDDVENLVIDPRLHLLVERGALGRIDGHACLGGQLVDHRILDRPIVERPFRVPQRIEQEVRLPQREEVHHRHLEVAIDPALAEPVRPGELFDRHPHARLAEPFRKDLRGFDVVRIVGGDLEHHVERPFGVARLGQQGLRLGDILRARLQIGVVGRRRRIGGRGRHLPLPPERPHQQRLLVDDQIEGKADTAVLEGFEGDLVEIDEIPVQREPFDDLQRVTAFDLFHPVGGNIVDHVQLAGLQPRQTGGVLGDLAAGDLFKVGRPFPVLVEALQLHHDARRVADELERTRTDRRLALHIARSLGHDHPGTVLGQPREERRVDLVQLDDGRQLIGRLDRLDGVEHLEIDRAGRRIAAAVERIFHIGRGHCLAVVELDPRAQLEGVGQPVVGDLEALAEPGNDVEVLVDGDDRGMDVLQNPAGRGGAGLVHVEVLHGLGVAPDQMAAADRRGLRAGHLREQFARDQRPADDGGGFQKVPAVHVMLRSVRPRAGWFSSLTRRRTAAPLFQSGSPGRRSATASSASSARPKRRIVPSSKSRPQSEMPCGTV